MCCLMFCTCIVSCKKATATDSGLVSVNIPLVKNNGFLKVSDISTDVSVIPLQTDSTTLLDKIIRIVHLKKTFYVADKNRVLAYDISGKLLNHFSNIGEGPDQYIGISDIQIDQNGLLWVLSRSNKCLYHYDWEGRLLNKYQLSFWGAKIFLMADGKHMLVYSGNEKDNENSDQLKILDISTGSVVDKIFPIDDKKSVYLHVMTDNNFVSSSSGAVYFQQIFNDTVYQLGLDRKPIPRFYLNFEGKNIPKSLFEKEYENIMDFFMNLHKFNYAYGVKLFMFNKETYLASFGYDKKTVIALSVDNSCKIGSSLKEDVCLGGYVIELTDQSFFQQSNEELIIPINAHSVLEHMQLNLNDQAARLLKKKVGHLTADDNPVLLKIKI